MLFRAFLRVLTPELPKQPNRGRYVCPSRPSAASWFRWEQGREELTGTFSVDRIGGEQGAMLAGQLAGKGGQFLADGAGEFGAGL